MVNDTTGRSGGNSGRQPWRNLSFSLLAVLALLLTACSGNAASDTEGTETAAEEASTTGSAGTPTDSGSPAAEEPIDITVAATEAYLTAGFLPRLGVQEGIFTEHGLNVEFVTASSSIEMGTAVVSNSADVGDVTPAVGWPMIDEGGELMYAVNEYPIEVQLIARPDLELSNLDEPYPAPLEDLRGMTVGVPAVGASQQSILLALAEEAGLSESDMDFVGIGGDGVTALQTGQIDFLMTNIPDEIRLGEDNFQVVIDSETISEKFGPVLSSAYVVNQDASQELVTRYCRAMTATLDYVLDPANEDTVAAYLSEAMNLTDEQARATIERYGPGFDVGLITEEVWDVTANSPVYGDLPLPDYEQYVYQGPC